MNADTFRTFAADCTNMNALDELWLFTEFDSTPDQVQAAHIYRERRAVLVGDGRTGEVLEELPEGF